MIDNKKEIFRWGPIPGKFYYVSEYLESISTKFSCSHPLWPETLLLLRNGKIVWISQMDSFRKSGRTLFLDYNKDIKTRENLYTNWKKK